MKVRIFQKFLAVTAVASLCLLVSNVQAQSNSTTAATPAPAAAPTAAASQAAPQLSYGVSEVLQLAHANVGEDVIVNYIQNSDNAYGLSANQIVFLKQQGIPDRIINTMLNQPNHAVAAPTVATPATPAPRPVSASTSTAKTTPLYSPRQKGQIPAASASTSTTDTSTATVAPTVTHVQTVPTTYYYQPYYPAYYGWPYLPVSLSFGWGWGGGRGGWHGGGWHGGGWHH